jgi:transcriptional regulator GlxA family with amidase domain
MPSVGLVVTPNFQAMNLAAISVFEWANETVGETIYDLRVLAEGGGQVRVSIGLNLETSGLDEVKFDTVIVGGSANPTPTTPGMREYIIEAAKNSRRIASICTGAFVLADAGVLDGRRATTHWMLAHELRERFPKIKVMDDQIFIVDGNVWTSAGLSAGIDLALGMVEKDLGADLARAVAQKLVVYHRRSGGQSQHSALLTIHPRSDRIQNALTFAEANLGSSLSVEQLAEAAHLSPRQFSRAFLSETGTSPAKAIQQLRLEAARRMVEQTRHSVDMIAAETGFGSAERMRRAFVISFGHPPQDLRRSARAAQ